MQTVPKNCVFGFDIQNGFFPPSKCPSLTGTDNLTNGGAWDFSGAGVLLAYYLRFRFLLPFSSRFNIKINLLFLC